MALVCEGFPHQRQKTPISKQWKMWNSKVKEICWSKVPCFFRLIVFLKLFHFTLVWIGLRKKLRTGRVGDDYLLPSSAAASSTAPQPTSRWSSVFQTAQSLFETLTGHVPPQMSQTDMDLLKKQLGERGLHAWVPWWWFQIFLIFPPKWGTGWWQLKYLLFSLLFVEKIPILTNTFQMGWNHQLGKISTHFDLRIFFNWVGEKPTNF